MGKLFPIDWRIADFPVCAWRHICYDQVDWAVPAGDDAE